MEGGRSVMEISKTINKLDQNKRVVSGRAKPQVNEGSNKSGIFLLEGQNQSKQPRQDNLSAEDQFEFEDINIMPLNGGLNTPMQNIKSKITQIAGQKSPKTKNLPPRFPLNDKNSSQDQYIHETSSVQNNLKSPNNQPSLTPNNQTQISSYRLPKQPDIITKNKDQKSSQPNNQLADSSLNAFLPTDYTKDRNLSYAQKVRKDINRKNPRNLLLPEPQPEQNIRETTSINNLFSDEFFAGRLSFVWLFIIAKAPYELMSKIQQVYRPITDRDYEIPFCRSVKEALQFFKAQNCYFKVIVDLDNGDELIKRTELEKKILSIYLYNNDPINGLKRAIRMKASSKKMRQCYNDLTPLLKRAQTDIQNGNKFVKQKQATVQDTVTEIKFRSSLPTFIKLNHQDKTEITAYRVNLYGAIKLVDPQQRHEKLQQFTRLVRRVYLNDQKQMNYLAEYLDSIDHVKCDPQDQTKHLTVLRFYVQESFYYKLTNNMLRVCRTVEEFKPLTIPFNQNYHAVKHFYDKTVAENKQRNQEMPEYTLYRGANLKQMDFKQLKEGDYIELLGFVSTSRNQQYTKKNFIRTNDDYLFIFNIKSRLIPDNLNSFDHGFVELAQYDIATTQFKVQQEVLLNALNVYRITKVIPPQKNQDNIGRVLLQYGAVFDLYQKPQNLLQNYQKNVLANYRFCIREMNQIEDHGDVLMKSEEYDKCKNFYKNKIQQEQKVEYFNKLAEAHFHCGQTDDARDNAIRSLLKYEQQINSQTQLDIEQCAKIFQIHEKNIKILLQKEDSLNAKKAVNFEIQLLDETKDWILKAEKLMERGQINLKEGNLIESEKDLKLSQSIIVNKKNSLKILRDQIHTKYFFKNLCCCFFQKKNALEQKAQELQKADEAEREMLKINDKVNELLLKINECFMNVAEVVGDKKTYEECVKKGRLYFEQYLEQVGIKEDVNVFEKAKIKVIEAKVENAFQQAQNIENSFKLMNGAIELIKKIDKNHEKVGEYSELLGKFHKKQFKRTMILPSKSKKQRSVRRLSSVVGPRVIPQESQNVLIQDSQENAQPAIQVYDEQQYKEKYIETKQNFEQALAVVTYHKTQNHPKVFQIRNNIAEVEYQYSNYSSGKQHASLVLRTEAGPKHSEGAKSALLIAKIHLSQGQIKEAFDHILKSHAILRVALLKEENNPKYQEILILSPIYMQIQLYKCKIYNRQMDHDLALKSITNLREIGKKKLRDADGVGYLADIYEEMGNILVCQGDTRKFQKYYEKALSLREHEMGKYNMMNAICYCTMAKYLIFINDMQTAEMYLSLAFEIFSRFAYDHPYFWIQLSTMAYLSQQMADSENQLRELRESVRLIEKRYSPSHINLMKMKLRYAQVLMKNNKYGEALPIYESLSKQMEEDVSLSRGEMTKNYDEGEVKANENEKVAIRDQVRKSLRDTRIKISNSQGLIMSKDNEGTKTQLIQESPDKINQNPEMESTKVKIRQTGRSVDSNPNMAQITEFKPNASKDGLFDLQ